MYHGFDKYNAPYQGAFFIRECPPIARKYRKDEGAIDMLADHHRQVKWVVDGRSGVVLLSLSCYNIGIGSTYRQEGETFLDGSNCARPTGINSDRVVPGPIGNHRLCHTVEV